MILGFISLLTWVRGRCVYFLEVSCISMQTGHHDLQDANLSEDVTVDNMITQNTQQGLHAQYAVWQWAKKKKKNLNNLTKLLLRHILKHMANTLNFVKIQPLVFEIFLATESHKTHTHTYTHTHMVEQWSFFFILPNQYTGYRRRTHKAIYCIFVLFLSLAQTPTDTQMHMHTHTHTHTHKHTHAHAHTHAQTHMVEQ